MPVRYYHNQSKGARVGKKQALESVARRNGRSAVTTRDGDLQSQRTRIFIQNALIELTEKRGFEGISVQDISRQAMINRATFYRHYRDKYHLVDEIFKGAVEKMRADMGAPHVFRDMCDLNRGLADEKAHAGWVSLFEHFASNSRMYAALLSGKGSAWFHSRMTDTLTKFLSWGIRGEPRNKTRPGIPPEIARCFFASATVGVAYLWLVGGKKHSARDMATWLRYVAYRGFIGTIAGLT